MTSVCGRLGAVAATTWLVAAAVAAATLLEPEVVRRRQWSCNDPDETCARVNQQGWDPPASVPEHRVGPLYSSAEACHSVCARTRGSLWPLPKKVRLDRTLIPFRMDDLTLVKPDLSRFEEERRRLFLPDLELALSEAWVDFTATLRKVSEASSGTGPPLSSSSLPGKTGWRKVSVSVAIDEDPGLDMYLSVNREAYELTISSSSGGTAAAAAAAATAAAVSVDLRARTFFGARHGLETLAQLVTFDDASGAFQVTSAAEIEDEPSFPYRGLMLDTSRNYFSVESIRRLVDGMALNKMNVFHWHISDSQSFPFSSRRVPEMSQFGAYSSREVYTADEIRELAEYARNKGVFLLPELDAPSHASHGWEWGPLKGLGNLTTCQFTKWIDSEGTRLAPEPPSGQLNPLNSNVYEVLEELYKDLVQAFHAGAPKKGTLRKSAPNPPEAPMPMFHMGGDEVNYHCWAQDPGIAAWLQAHSFPTSPYSSSEGFLALWADFQRKALERLRLANKDFRDGVVLWTSDMTKPGNAERFLDPLVYVIQVWTNSWDSSIGDLLAKKYRLILSNSDAWYLDCGFDAWLYEGVGPENNWCSPFKGWKTMYSNSPREIVRRQGFSWKDHKDQILGGEGTMWSEQVDEFAVEAKVWPRASAIAERLWSDPVNTTWRDAEPRMLEHRRRMARYHRIRADAVQPELCRQDEGTCFSEKREFPAAFQTFEDEAAAEFRLRQQPEAFGQYPPTGSGDKGSTVILIYEDFLIWTCVSIFAVVLLIVKRRFFMSMALWLFQYCKETAKKGGPSFRMVTIR